MSLGRSRTSRSGELVHWKTSKLTWLEGRGERICLIALIDSVTERAFARFARHNSSEENLRFLWTYVTRWGRPKQIQTEKSSLFRGNPRHAGEHKDGIVPGWSQVRAALDQLDIRWRSYQAFEAQAEPERFFKTAKDLLIRGLREAGADTLEEANLYLEETYLPMWNKSFTRSSSLPDAHRPLLESHLWDSAVRTVAARSIGKNRRLVYRGHVYQIQSVPELRGCKVEIEERLDGTFIARRNGRPLELTLQNPSPARSLSRPTRKAAARQRHLPKHRWMDGFFERQGPPLWTTLK